MENEEMCSICNEVSQGGINLLGSYICKKCEEEMMKEDLSEMRMEYYKSKVKNIWRNNLS